MNRFNIILKDFKKIASLYPQKSIERLVRIVRAELKSSVCSIYLYNSNEEAYILCASKGLNINPKKNISLKTGEGLIGFVAEKEELINISNAKLHFNYKYIANCGEEKYPAILAVPIVHQQKCLGVISIQHHSNKKFSEFYEAFLLTLAAAISNRLAVWQQDGTLNQLTDYKTILDEQDTKYKGVSASHGISLGIGYIVNEESNYEVLHSQLQDCESIENELMLFSQALSDVRIEILKESSALAGIISDNERMIFTTYVQMLDDNNLGGEVKQLIKQKYDAQSAWKYTISKYCQNISLIGDQYLSSRINDIRDLGNRVLRKLNKSEQILNFKKQATILIANEVTPSMLLNAPKKHLAGIISIQGSTNSHLAIIARSLGVPTVLNVTGFNINNYKNKQLAVDGNNGIVIGNLSKNSIQQYQKCIEDDLKFTTELQAINAEETKTIDGHSIELLANSGLFETEPDKIFNNYGVGLYRSESIFFNRDYFPSEDVQEKLYRQELQRVFPNQVNIRTLDIGGDKSLPYFEISEDNPYLGWRGIRISLDHPEIFIVQIRAMLKANIGLQNLRILLPMIAFIDELDDSIKIIEHTYQSLLKEGFLDVVLPRIGIMLEIPSMIQQISKLEKKIAFISVGSNDLVQYIQAVDRNNSNVAKNYRPLAPSMLSILKQIKQMADKANIEASICGEIASNFYGILPLVAMGYSNLSMNHNHILAAKSIIRSISIASAKQLLDELIAMNTEEQVIKAIENYLINEAKIDKKLKFY